MNRELVTALEWAEHNSAVDMTIPGYSLSSKFHIARNSTYNLITVYVGSAIARNKFGEKGNNLQLIKQGNSERNGCIVNREWPRVDKKETQLSFTSYINLWQNIFYATLYKTNTNF